MKRRRKNRAFTLIELLLVMVILAVLAGVAVPMYMGQAAKAKVNATKATMTNLRKKILRISKMTRMNHLRVRGPRPISQTHMASTTDSSQSMTSISSLSS